MSEITTYPFSPVTGKGLGVCYSSLAKTGVIRPQQGYGAAGLMFYPNLSNGNLYFKDRILKIPQPNFLLELGFVYNSQAGEPKEAWRFHHKQFMVLPKDGDPGVLEEADGHLTQYLQDPNDSNVYYAQDSVKSTKFMVFDKTLNQWILQTPDTGIVEYYDLNGLLQKRTDARGRATTYEYEGRQLSKITTPTGNHYAILRNGNNVSIVDADQNKVLQQYVFDDLNRLVSSSTSDNYTTTYTYKDNTSRLSTVSQSDGSYLNFDLLDAGLDKFDMGKGGIGQSSGLRRVWITYADNSHPNQAVIRDNTSQITLTYDQNADLQKAQFQNGYDVPSLVVDEINYTYDPNTHQLSTTTLPGKGVESRTYGSFGQFKNVLTKQVKPNGQTAEFEYQVPEGTNILNLVCKISYLDPQTPLLTRYVYEVIRDQSNVVVGRFLRFIVSPEGRITEYRRNPSDPNFNVDTERTYLIDKFISPNHLLNLADLEAWASTRRSQVSLKKYGYDQYGQVNQVNEYSDVDANGNGIENSGMGVKKVVNNRFGNAEQTTVRTATDINTITNAVSSQTYDELQRPLLKTDALKNQTQQQYLDSKSQIKTTFANGSTALQSYDSRGILFDKTSTAQTIDKITQTRDEQYLCDSGGRLAVTTLADGVTKIYTYYDRQDRIGYIVTSLGIVTEYQYDEKNRFNSVTTYDQPVDVKKLFRTYPPGPGVIPIVSRLAPLIKKNPLKDQTSYEFFDLSGRKTYEVDAKQYVTQHFYDNLDNDVGTIAYKTQLMVDQLNQLKAGQELNLTFNPIQDKATRIFRDNDGLIIGKQDSAGYITQYVRDAGGRVTQKNVYYDRMPIDFTLPFSRILNQLSGRKAASTLYGYNARGQMIAKLDPEKYYSEYTYTPDGLKLSQKLYANKLTTSFPSKPESSPLDQEITYENDLLGRRVKTNGAFKRIDSIQFDKMGNPLFKTSQDSSAPDKTDGDHLRQTGTLWDGWNQAVDQANVFIGKLLAEAKGDPDKIAKIWATQSKRQKFDETGLLLYTIDEEGYRTYFYYDKDRRPIIKISSTLSISESTLNSFGFEVVNRKYNNRFNGELKGGIVDDTLRKLFDGLQSSDDHVIQYERDQRNQVTEIIDAKLNVTKKEYDAFKRLEVEHLPVNSPDPTLDIKHYYDTRDNEIATMKVDTLTEQTKIELREFDNPLNKQTAYVNELGGKEQYEHDLKGNVNTIVRDGIIVNRMTHDFLDRVETEADAYGNIKKHKYTPDHQHIITPPTGQGAHTQQLSPFNQVVSDTSNGPDGKPVSVTKTHAPDGQAEDQTDQLGNTASQKFNNKGKKTTHSDANGSESKYGYDGDDNVTSVQNDAKGINQTVGYQPDAFGNPNVVTDARNNPTNQGFDKNNNLNQTQRVVTNLDGSKSTLVQNMEHNAQGKQVLLTQGDVNNPKQYTEKTVVNGFNEEVGTVIDPDGLDIENISELNAAGLPKKIIDANGNVTYKFYDVIKQDRFEVSPTGGVTERFYDKNGKLKYVRVYEQDFKADDGTKYDDLVAFAAKFASTDDTLLYYFYDANGNEVYRVTSLGAVSESVYDDGHPQREIETIVYSNPILASMLNPDLPTDAITKAIVPDEENDRSTLINRDAKGQPVRVADPECYVTDTVFDKNGNPIIITRYENPVEISKGSRTIPTPAASKNNRIKYIVYDGLNRKIFEVETFDLDANTGRVRQYFYDKNNNPLGTCEYTNTLMIPDTYDALVAQVKLLEPDPKKDNLTSVEFDEANRKNKETDGLGFFDLYMLNALGLTQTQIDKIKAEWGYQYDGAKRQSLEIAPPMDVMAISRDAGTGALTGTLQPQVSSQKKTEYYKTGDEKTITLGFGSEEPRIADSGYDSNNQLISMQTKNVPVDDPNKVASLIDLPVTNQTLQKRTVYHKTKKYKVAECDENNQWTFYVRNSEGQEVFTIFPTKAVHEHVRNTFGEIEFTCLYADGIDIDLTQYQETGIPLKVVQDAMASKKANPLNRAIANTRNRNGKVTDQLTQGTIIYFVVIDGKNQYGVLSPEVQFGYNAFGEHVYRATRLDPNRWAEEFAWFNRAGKQVAKFNVNGRVDLSFFTSPFHDPTCTIQWGCYTTQKPDRTTTLTQLLSYYQKDASRPDVILLTERDQIGQEVAKGNADVTVQDIVVVPGQPPVFTNTSLKKRMTRYQRNGLGSITVTTYADGSEAYKFYNSHNQLVAETGVPQIDNDGDVWIPLTWYFLNLFDQNVGYKKFSTGMGLFQPLNGLPQPVRLDPANDQVLLKLVDTARGKPLVTQEADGSLFGFTCTKDGKLARTFYPRTTRRPDGTSFDRMIEQRYGYGAFKDPIFKETYLDNVLKFKRLMKRNMFEEVAEEGYMNPQLGLGLGDRYYIQYDRNAAGQLWRTNHIKGIWTITLGDLAGHIGLSATSEKVDLSKVTYDALIALLNEAQTDIDLLQMTRTECDEAGRDIRGYPPAYLGDDFNVPQNISLGMAVGTEFTDIGDVSISWPHPVVTNLQPTFTLWQIDNPEQKTTLPVIKTDTRFGVDITKYPSDVYAYEIVYHSEYAPDKVLYQTLGTFQCDTKNTANSKRLVVEVQSCDQLFLTGNTVNLTSVNLFKDGQQIDVILISNNNYTLDLSKYPSGSYTVQPVVTGQSDLPQSLPFTIYAAIPSATPLSQEFYLMFCLSYLYVQEFQGKHYYMAELVWSLDGKYNDLPIDVTIEYMINDVPQTPVVVTIDQKTFLGDFKDQNNKVLKANIAIPATDGEPITTPFEITSLTIKLNLDAQTQITLCNGRGNDGVDGGKGASIIRTLIYNPTSTLYIVPEAGFDPQNPPTLFFWDTGSGTIQEWQAIQAIGTTQNGIVVDATPLVSGRYAYQIGSSVEDVFAKQCVHDNAILRLRVQGKEAEAQELEASWNTFTVSRGSVIYPSIPILTTPEESQPHYQKDFDTNDNVRRFTDTLGRETDNEYDARTKLVKTTHPEVEVDNMDGTTTRRRPVTLNAYNIRDVFIGSVDGNGHITGFVVDAQGNQCQRVLGDGTIDWYKNYNALQQLVAQLDSRKKRTTMKYSLRNFLVERGMPSGYTQYFWWNQSGLLGWESNSANEPWFYQQDVNGNNELITSPEGATTAIVSDLLTNKPTSTIKVFKNITRSSSAEYDEFGFEKNRTDLGGATVVTKYNGRKQVLNVSSSGGNHGKMITGVATISRIAGTNKWAKSFKIIIVDTPNQNMNYIYRNDSALIGGIDLAANRVTKLIVDSEAQTVRMQAKRNGNVVRTLYTLFDGLKRPVLMVGTEEVVTQRYDGEFNIIYRKVVLTPQGLPPTQNESWFKPDAADRIVVDDGDLVNGSIQIQPGKGTGLTYQDGFRVKESKIDSAGTLHENNLAYDDDGLLKGANDTDGNVSTRTYDGAQRPSTYVNTRTKSSIEKDIDTQAIQFNKDSLLTDANVSKQALVKVGDEWQLKVYVASDTQYGDFDPYGLPQSQNVHYSETDSPVGEIYDNLTSQPLLRDAPEQSVTSGQRTDDDGTSNVTTAMDFAGPNPGEMSGQSMQIETLNIPKLGGGLLPPKTVLGSATSFENECLTGITMSKEDFIGLKDDETQKAKKTTFLNDVNGNWMGSTQVNEDANDPRTYAIDPSISMPGTKGALVVSGNRSNIIQQERNNAVNESKAQTNFDIGNKDINPVSQSFPPPSADVVQVKSGDTLETIAQMECGTADAASAISAANAYITDDTLQVGMALRIPQYILAKFNLGTTEQYQDFINTVQVNLYPILVAAEPKSNSFWCQVVDIAIIGAAVGLASLATGGAAIAVAMAAGGAMEAGAEELEIKFGWRQTGFSLRAVAQEAVNAGFAEIGAEIAPTAPVAGQVDPDYIPKVMLQAGMLSVAQQTASLAISKNASFDMQAVLVQMITAGVAAYSSQALQKLQPLSQNSGFGEQFLRDTELNLITTIASGLVQGLLNGGKIDVQGMAANFLGNELGSAAADAIKTSGLKTTVQDWEDKAASAFPQLTHAMQVLSDAENALIDDIEKPFKALEDLFSQPLTAPNAQQPVSSIRSQSQNSNAKAIANQGLFRRNNQKNYLSNTGANGNYIPNSNMLGGDLALGSEPDEIKYFNVNISDPDVSWGPTTGGDASLGGVAQNASFATGTGAAIGENLNVVNNKWLGDNWKLYDFTHQPNQWTGPRNINIENAEFFWKVGVGVFVVDLMVGGIETKQELSAGDYQKASQTGMDVIMSGVATFGGIAGAAIGLGYLGVKEVVENPSAVGRVLVEMGQFDPSNPAPMPRP